jgi:excinuclease UvrABC nuclease subunit
MIKFKKSNIKLDVTFTITETMESPLEYQEIIVTKETLKSPATSKSGVYEIRNKFCPERFYIGQSRNLVNRWRKHINDLINDNHHCSMQEDWNLFKEQNQSLDDLHPAELFEIRLIIYCYPSHLNLYEKFLIDNLNPYYNIKKTNNEN